MGDWHASIFFSFFACSTYLLLRFFCCKRMARRLEEMICQLKNGMEGKDGYVWSKKVSNAANVCQSSYQKIVVFLYFVVFPIIRPSRLYGCA